MLFQTKLSCGDRVWYFTGSGAIELTIGQVQGTFTKSKGLKRGEFFHGQVLTSDNVLPKSDIYEERYMCVETGIGSGSIHTLGKTIFLTRDECLAAHAEEIERKRQYEQRRREEEREQLIRERKAIDARLAELDGNDSAASLTDAEPA